MNRLTKILYFSALALIAFSQLLQGNLLLATLLFILTGLALYMFEKREAKRHFYRAMRRLYVCVDGDAFKKEVANLEKRALIKSATVTPLKVLKIIEAYYEGRRDTVVSDLLELPKDTAYQFWIDCYIGLNDNSKLERLQIRKTLAKVPREFRVIAVQRCEVLELMQKQFKCDSVDTGEIEALRECVNTNLLIAELTKCLRDQTNIDRIRNYYDQAVKNLSKGLDI